MRGKQTNKLKGKKPVKATEGIPTRAHVKRMGLHRSLGYFSTDDPDKGAIEIVSFNPPVFEHKWELPPGYKSFDIDILPCQEGHSIRITREGDKVFISIAGTDLAWWKGQPGRPKTPKPPKTPKRRGRPKWSWRPLKLPPHYTEQDLVEICARARQQPADQLENWINNYPWPFGLHPTVNQVRYWIRRLEHRIDVYETGGTVYRERTYRFRRSKRRGK